MKAAYESRSNSPTYKHEEIDNKIKEHLLTNKERHWSWRSFNQSRYTYEGATHVIKPDEVSKAPWKAEPNRVFELIMEPYDHGAWNGLHKQDVSASKATANP